MPVPFSPSIVNLTLAVQSIKAEIVSPQQVMLRSSSQLSDLHVGRKTPPCESTTESFRRHITCPRCGRDKVCPRPATCNGADRGQRWGEGFAIPINPPTKDYSRAVHRSKREEAINCLAPWWEPLDLGRPILMACKDGGQSTTTRHVAAERIRPKLGFNRRYQTRTSSKREV